MLTAMPVALAHGHPAPAFNGVFYATVATIIPVLFIAIAVQEIRLRGSARRGRTG